MRRIWLCVLLMAAVGCGGGTDAAPATAEVAAVATSPPRPTEEPTPTVPPSSDAEACELFWSVPKENAHPSGRFVDPAKAMSVSVDYPVDVLIEVVKLSEPGPVRTAAVRFLDARNAGTPATAITGFTKVAEACEEWSPFT